MAIKIPVSFAEVIDKLTILEIKESKIKDKQKLSLIKKEILLLRNEVNKFLSTKKNIKVKLDKLKTSLRKINLCLWNIEDKIRKHEAQKSFHKKFIQLARNVYITNDKRSHIKSKINELTGSEITEVKHYVKY